MRARAFVVAAGVGALVAVAGCALVGGYDFGGYEEGPAKGDASDATFGGDADATADVVVTGDSFSADAGADAAADAIPDAPADVPPIVVYCDAALPPADASVTAMVGIAAPPGGFCIDRTEVTNQQYLDFISYENGDAGGQPAACAANVSYAPQMQWPFDPDAGDLPVRFVNECDAVAYCSFVNKRVCGDVDGGPVASSDVNKAQSEWYYACALASPDGGTLTYPYGDNYDGTACNGLDYDAGGPVPVGSLPGCVGSAPGLYDMSGNVAEWEDSCETADGSDSCKYRGGSYDLDSGSLRCQATTTFFVPRLQYFRGVGIRCCWP